MKGLFKKANKFLSAFEPDALQALAYVIMVFIMLEGIKMHIAEKSVLLAIILLIIVVEKFARNSYKEAMNARKGFYADAMKEQTEELRKILSVFQILPMEINEEYRILSVQKLSGPHFDVTAWEITGEYKYEFFKGRIIRKGDESNIDIITELKETKTPDEIYLLDCSAEFVD